jgi:heme/copper-type cytochrome/quinol oxidase subunit 2
MDSDIRRSNSGRPHLPKHGITALALVPVLWGVACSPVINTDMRGIDGGYASDTRTIQIVSTNVQGKNVYIPSTIVVTAGTSYTLSVFNTTDIPHGFTIVGAGIQEILPPKREHKITLPALDGGNVYGVRCHLHPAHRTGMLVVLPAP